MKQKLLALRQDTLFRNSIYLMVSTGIMALLGFVFWLINARLFTPSQIGVATTLISAMNLISYIALLGFNSTFIRFLPTSKDRSNEINTGLLLSIIMAALVSTGYILLIPYIAPKLGIVHHNPWYAIGFVIMAALAAINLLTDSIFIAYRAAKYNLLIDGIIMSSIKLALPFLLVGLGAYGVFAASGSAASVAMALSILFLTLRFNYRPEFKIRTSTLRKVLHYSFSNYVGNLLNIAPTLVLPLVVINHLGAAAAGYYYLAFMVANLLYTVVYAVSQSLFAEGSYANQTLRELVKRSSAVVAGIMVPGTIILYFGAHLILGTYGKNYGSKASSLLTVLALAAPAVAIYTIVTVLLRINKQVYSLIVVNIIYLLTISGFATLWVDRGLKWIGYAWAMGQITAGLAGLLVLLLGHKSKVQEAIL
ncbi:MAG TPA: oligosaccharide flippase family protein [Candidatus Saccharimonadales bacterium]|nr:oligosaccharide flippase family protein [Candidatus Saccharimonadales bacterium]